MSIWIEKQLLRINYAKNPRFVLTGGVLTGWTHSSSLTPVDTGGVSLSYTGSVQTFSFTDVELPRTDLFWNVEVIVSASSSVTLERADGGTTQSKTFSLVADENRVLYLNTTAQAGQPTFRIRWTGNPGVTLNLVSAYVSEDPGATFSGDDTELVAEDPADHRVYEWTSTAYNSFSRESTGGIWAAEWVGPPRIKARDSKPPEPVKRF